LQRTKRNIGFRSLAETSKIPKSTLHRWISKQPSKAGAGRPAVMTSEEEGILVAALKFMAQCNMPWERKDVKIIIKEFLDDQGRPNQFKDNVPSDDWVRGFEKRHPELSQRSVELLTLARIKHLTPDTVHAFFDLLEPQIIKFNLANAPNRIWNLMKLDSTLTPQERE
jgi:hypothetical protein